MEAPLFHGLKIPSQALQQEDTIDRQIFYLVALGKHDGIIAEELGVSAAKVSMTRRQPWFVKRMVEFLHEKGAAAVEERLQKLMPEMMELGANLARSADSEAVRCNAIFGMLKVIRGDKLTVVEEAPDLATIKAKRAEVERQLKELRGAEPTPRVELPNGDEPTKPNGNGASGHN